MPSTWPAFTVALMLASGATVASGQRVAASFGVTVRQVPAGSQVSSCATSTTSGAAARVDCLTRLVPVFSAPGRPDVIATSLSASRNLSLAPSVAAAAARADTAATTPSTTSVTGLGATAAGAPGGELAEGDEPGAAFAGAASGAAEPGADGRRTESAVLEGAAGAPPPEEIEVAF